MMVFNTTSGDFTAAVKNSDLDIKLILSNRLSAPIRLMIKFRRSSLQKNKGNNEKTSKQLTLSEQRMSWVRGQVAPSLHMNMLTANSNFSIQGTTGSHYQSIYELTTTPTPQPMI